MFIKERKRGLTKIEPLGISLGAGMAIGGIASGLLGKSSSDKASKYARDASRLATEEQRRQYDLTRGDLSPYLGAGTNSLNAYQQALGFTPTTTQSQPLSFEQWSQTAPSTAPSTASGNNFITGGRDYLIESRQQKQQGGEPSGQEGYANYLAGFQPQTTTTYGDYQAPDTNMYDPFVNDSQVPQYSNQVGAPPQYTNQAGAPPEYVNQVNAIPTFQDRDRFNFNLQEDPIYQYQRDQALQASTRGQNAAGGQLSGGLLRELSRVGAGESGKYQDAAFRRQLAASKENYGRGVGEYGMDVAQNQGMYSRGVQDYGLAAERNRDIYGRGVQDYGLDAARNRDMYGRGVQDYGLGLQGNQAQYTRDVGQYGLDVQRNMDQYARDQNQLNRLYDLSMGGQNAAALLGGFGANSAANIGNAAMQGAGMRGNAAIQGASSINNALQGTMSNYLFNNYLNQAAPAPNNYLTNGLGLTPYGGGVDPLSIAS